MEDEYLKTHFGNYRPSQLIGKGGFARVYKSEHVALGTAAAVKVLRTKYSQDREKVAQFYREARLIARFDNRHIVHILDCSDEKNEGNIHYFVMDYAPNGLLRQFAMPGNLLPLSTVISYVKQIAEALQYVHDQGYVHRDVKLENILLDANHTLLLCDFGIAVPILASPHEHVSDIGGTVEYMAPEQLRRKPVPASDQYSLAVVTYALLTGDCPFHGTSTEVARQHKYAQPPSLRGKMPGIPPAIERVVMKGLAKDPHMRYPSVRAYAIALERAYNERPLAPSRHPVNRHAQAARTRRLPVDVQSRPVVSQGFSADIQSEPLPVYQSSAPIQSEPLPVVRPRPAGVRGQRPRPLAAPVQQQRRPERAQQQQRRPVQHIHPAKILDVFELLGRVTAAICFSVGMGAAMFFFGVGDDVALSLSAVILLIMLDILLLSGWATLLVPLIMFAVCIATGMLFHSWTFFGMSVVFMCIVLVVSKLSQRHN